MIKIWHHERKYLKKNQNSLSQYCVVKNGNFYYYYYYFARGRADATFKLWASKGLEKIQELYLPNSDIMLLRTKE